MDKYMCLDALISFEKGHSGIELAEVVLDATQRARYFFKFYVRFSYDDMNIWLIKDFIKFKKNKSVFRIIALVIFSNVENYNNDIHSIFPLLVNVCSPLL